MGVLLVGVRWGLYFGPPVFGFANSRIYSPVALQYGRYRIQVLLIPLLGVLTLAHLQVNSGKPTLNPESVPFADYRPLEGAPFQVPC